jgi:hypothetical protein
MQPPPLRAPVQWRSWRERPLGSNLDVVERRDAPDEALGMKVSEDGLGIMNVRFAGDPAVLRTLMDEHRLRNRRHALLDA